MAVMVADFETLPALATVPCAEAIAEYAENSVVSLLRKGQSTANLVVAVCNFTPVPRAGYRLGVPRGGFWREALNSDAVEYGGSGVGNLGGIETESVVHHGRPCSLVLTLPPLAVAFFINIP